MSRFRLNEVMFHVITPSVVLPDAGGVLRLRRSLCRGLGRLPFQGLYRQLSAPLGSVDKQYLALNDAHVNKENTFFIKNLKNKKGAIK